MTKAGASTEDLLFLGIDVGTSGVRLQLINDLGDDVYQTSVPLSPIKQSNPQQIERPVSDWRQALSSAWDNMASQFDCQAIKSIAIDGTSGTVFLADPYGEPISPALMYNDARAIEQAARIQAIAPKSSPARAVTSGLSKILWLQQHFWQEDAQVVHQADDLVQLFSGMQANSDANNCLKSGFDPEQNQWSVWLSQLELRVKLPKVKCPGRFIATVSDNAAQRFSLSAGTLVIAGTTDSHAATLATGANNIGDAITSLGSTLVTKVISAKPVFNSDYGVYSQPFADNWLVGGASNSGGAVLREYFSDEQMRNLSESINPNVATGLDYYPLLSAGERFPVNDANLQPKLSPRPKDDTLFFHGLLEGIANIEKQAYDRLHQLGAPYPRTLRTVGGGRINQVWSKIRETILQIEITTCEHTEAAYGSALLAKQGYNTHKQSLVG